MKRTLLIGILMVFVVISAAFGVDVDGTIAQGEYAREETFDKGSFRLLWRIVGDTAYMAIEAAAKGWVSVGFEPTRVMANSDMIFGFVEASGAVRAVDAWSTGLFGPHPPDADQGGSDSILAFAGSRSGDKVVFEFSRLLDTKDKFDKVIPVSGSFKIIWAYSQNMGFTAKHNKAGSATLNMGGSE